MKKLLLFLPLVALVACDPLVTDGDLKARLEALGFSKVMIQPARLNCGRFGQGKRFLGSNKQGQVVLGQICYLKAARDVQYKVDILSTMTPIPDRASQ